MPEVLSSQKPAMVIRNVTPEMRTVGKGEATLHNLAKKYFKLVNSLSAKVFSGFRNCITRTIEKK